MGPTPLQIMIVVGIALLLFAAGRIADVGRGPRDAGRTAKGTRPLPAPKQAPEPEPDEPAEASTPEAGAGVGMTDSPDRDDADEKRAS